MPKFEKVKAATTVLPAVRYDLEQIVNMDPLPHLMVRPTTASNKDYQNALRAQNRNNRRAAAGFRNLTDKQADRLRDSQRKLFARHVVAGWGDVVDDTGKPVKFSPKNCQDFLFALDNWVFDELALFTADGMNFQKAPDLDEDPDDEDATGKS